MRSNKPLLSVCVPSYNNQATITRCITSILAQTWTNFELVIFDDCSSDSTLAICEKLLQGRSNTRILQHRENVGLVANHNACLSAASCDWVKFVHADDWILPSCLKEFAAYMDEPNLSLVFSQREIAGPDQEWQRRHREITRAIEPLDRINDGREIVARYINRGLVGNPIGEPTAILVNRKLACSIGGFQEDLPQLLDIDLWLRLLLRGEAGWLATPVSVRFHSDSSTTVRNRKNKAGALDQLTVFELLGSDPAVSPGLRRAALLRWCRTVASLLVRSLIGWRLVDARAVSVHLASSRRRWSRKELRRLDTKVGG